MALFNRGDKAELRGELDEPFFFRRLRESFVHVGPLVILTFGGGEKIRVRLADSVELLEPHLRVLAFVLRRLEEERRNLLVSFLLRNRREIRVLVARARFACERRFKVLLRLRSSVLRRLRQLVSVGLATRANRGFAVFYFKDFAADFALIFRHLKIPPLRWVDTFIDLRRGPITRGLQRELFLHIIKKKRENQLGKEIKVQKNARHFYIVQNIVLIPQICSIMRGAR